MTIHRGGFGLPITAVVEQSPDGNVLEKKSPGQGVTAASSYDGSIEASGDPHGTKGGPDFLLIAYMLMAGLVILAIRHYANP